MKTLLRLAFCAALIATAQAQPAYMNYQGKLTDNNGQPLPSSGTNTLEFNIYTAASGGSPVWGPFLCDGGVSVGHTARTIVSSGRFNVILGPTDTTSRPIQAVFTTSTLFLDIKVNAATILPRQQFLSAPYAFTALNSLSSLTVSDPDVARRAGGNTFTGGDQNITGNATVTGNVRAQGLLRSGSETGTAEPPAPAGLVIRRINSTSSTAGQVVARTDQLTLERDGTTSGLLIRYPTNVNKQTFMVRYMNNDGNSYTYFRALDSSIVGTAASTFALATAFPGNVIDWEITFGDMTYSGLGHYTQVHLTRYNVDSQLGTIPAVRNWIGTLTSTFNQ